MQEYLPYILYSMPFAVALFVLVRNPKSTADAIEEIEEAPVIDEEDQLIEEVRSRPLRRPYASYRM